MALSEAAVEAIGGAIGSCIAFSITYPLTTVSTWQALEQKAKHNSSQEDANKWSTYLKFVPSPLKEVLQHAAARGWGPLYAGIRPFLVATGISQGLYFYFYSIIRQGVVAFKAKQQQALQSNSGQHTQQQQQQGSSRSQDIGVLGSVVVASLAGCLNALATHPMWLVTTRMQAAQRKPDAEKLQQSSLSIATEVYRQEGIAGLWKGVTPALIMVINPTIQFILYEWLVARIRDFRSAAALAKAAGAKVATAAKLSAGDAFLMSALAKLGATLVTYPMLLIKNRMQASSSSSSADEQYDGGVWDALVRIVGSEGVKGLFKGMKAKMLQTVLGAALLMAIKEEVFNAVRSLQNPGRLSAALVTVVK